MVLLINITDSRGGHTTKIYQNVLPGFQESWLVLHGQAFHTSEF